MEPPNPVLTPLQAVVGEVEGHVAEAGWDQPPQLFALVPTEALLAAEPQLARTMGLVAGDPSSLTPVAQEPLGDGPLDERLATLVFGDEVLGVVLAHEVVVLPPCRRGGAGRGRATRRPWPRSTPSGARCGWSSASCATAARPACCGCAARRREQDERVTGQDLAPGLVAALQATLEEPA